MTDFDREALAAAAAKANAQDSNFGFYAAVIALPVIGILVGAFFMTSGQNPAPSAPVILAEQAPETVPGLSALSPSPGSAQAELQKQILEQAGIVAPDESEGWSASAEMNRYTVTRSALMYCSRVGSVDTSLSKSFTEKNAAAFAKLQAIKSAEWKSGRSERNRLVQQANNEMMVGLLTGDTQRRALETSFEFSRAMKEMEQSQGQPGARETDPRIIDLLGGEPDLATCTKLKIAVQRGSHDIKFEK